MLNFLIVDDHPLIREGLIRLLAQAFPDCNTQEASEASAAMNAVWAKNWDLVILDLSLPGRSGLELLKEMRSARPGLPVAVVTFHPEERFSVRVLRAGASAYLPKHAPADVMVQAFRQVLAGGCFITARAGEIMAANLKNDQDKPLHEKLSDREYDIFARLGQGATVGEIAQSLNLSVKTISTYRARIINKTGLRNNAAVAQYAIRNQLVD